MMRVAITVRADASSWAETVTYVQEAERLGVAVCFAPEAWGTDAVTPLAYLAARTERMVLGSGIMQISSRTPAMTAQTALTLAAVSGNRFILGLGVSGPQVVEGLHGQPFAHPLGRMRETIAIIRQAFAGERVSFQGQHFQLPRAGGEGKALRIDQPPNPHIPIYLATLAPRMLALTGELADGWLGTSFIPEGAAAYLDHLAAGAARAGRSLTDLPWWRHASLAWRFPWEEWGLPPPTSTTMRIVARAGPTLLPKYASCGSPGSVRTPLPSFRMRWCSRPR
jgi:F420-dependent oxidoreductase-like protein